MGQKRQHGNHSKVTVLSLQGLTKKFFGYKKRRISFKTPANVLKKYARKVIIE
jgi:hypothetical protein